MPWSSGGRRSGGGPPRDLEDLLRRGQDKIKQAMPGGGGLPGSFVFLAVVVIMAVAAFFAFTFRVDPDELGIVLRFGKPVRSEPPGFPALSDRGGTTAQADQAEHYRGRHALK